jgi:hypothetical protein
MNFTEKQTIEILGIAGIPNAVFSKLFIGQLKNAITSGSFNAGAVIDVIKNIQSGTLKNKKGVRDFKGNILKGFSYAHWFEASFIPKNLQDHWKTESPSSKKMFNAISNSIKKSGVKKGENITRESVSQISKDIVDGIFQRSKQGQLTGEWIIFHKKEMLNTYLTIATHHELDETIYLRMVGKCGLEFPELFPK